MFADDVKGDGCASFFSSSLSLSLIAGNTLSCPNTHTHTHTDRDPRSKKKNPPHKAKIQNKKQAFLSVSKTI